MSETALIDVIVSGAIFGTALGLLLMFFGKNR